MYIERTLPEKLPVKPLFYQVGKWYVPTNKFDEPEAASIRIASWLQNYYVETMVDHPNQVIFKTTAMVREKNSPFHFINDGTLTFRKAADASYLEIDYQINMFKTAATLVFFPVNQAFALHQFKSIIFEGLTQDPISVPTTPEKLRLTKNELLFLYVVIAPVIAGLIEMLRLSQDLPAHPAITEIIAGKNLWMDAFGLAIFFPVAILSTWMILLWIYVHDHRDTLLDGSEKNTQELMIVIVTILLLWITIVWAIYQVYVNVSTFSLSLENFPGFFVEYWMGGICFIWALGFAFLFVKNFK